MLLQLFLFKILILILILSVIPEHSCPTFEFPGYPETLDTVCATYHARPCCVEMSAIYDVNEKVANTNSELVYPNCDTRGFYESKQCGTNGYYCVNKEGKRSGTACLDTNPKQN